MGRSGQDSTAKDTFRKPAARYFGPGLPFIPRRSGTLLGAPQGFLGLCELVTPWVTPEAFQTLGDSTETPILCGEV